MNDFIMNETHFYWATITCCRLLNGPLKNFPAGRLIPFTTLVLKNAKEDVSLCYSRNSGEYIDIKCEVLLTASFLG